MMTASDDQPIDEEQQQCNISKNSPNTTERSLLSEKFQKHSKSLKSNLDIMHTTIPQNTHANDGGNGRFEN